MKSENLEITANCVKEIRKKCRLVGKANFSKMSSPSCSLRSPRFVKIGGLAQMLTVKTCISFFLLSSCPVEKKAKVQSIVNTQIWA